MSSDGSDSDSINLNDSQFGEIATVYRARHQHGSRCSKLTYDEAISKTVNRRSCWCFNMWWQNFSFLVIICGVISCNPIILGMCFLEREPNDFRCRVNGIWKACEKTYVCTVLGGDRELYYAVDNDYYIENWVKRFDMLCQPKMLVGMLGFSYFVGVVVATLLVTQFTETSGKKQVFCVSMLISLVGQAGIMFWANSILTASLCLVVIGLSWPGKRVVGIDYILDFYPQRYRPARILWMNLLDYPSLLLIALAYEYLQKTWMLQQYIGLACSSVCLLYCYFLMKKSPFYLYGSRQFAEAKEVIEYVQRMNCDHTKYRYQFDREHDLATGRNRFQVYRMNEEQQLVPVEARQLNAPDSSGSDEEPRPQINGPARAPLVINEADKAFYDNHGQMLNDVYRMNVVRMTLMYSSLYFMTFMMYFQLKYLQGDIYENAWYCAAADALAILCVAIAHFMDGLKLTYYLSFAVSMLGLLGILYIENNYESDPTVLRLEKYEFYRRMPMLIFYAKFGMAMALLSTQVACLTDSKLFPRDRRNSAVGFCNLVAKAITSLAPIINELDESTPIMILLIVLSIAIINAATLVMPTTPPQENQQAQQAILDAQENVMVKKEKKKIKKHKRRIKREQKKMISKVSKNS